MEIGTKVNVKPMQLQGEVVGADAHGIRVEVIREDGKASQHIFLAEELEITKEVEKDEADSVSYQAIDEHGNVLGNPTKESPIDGKLADSSDDTKKDAGATVVKDSENDTKSKSLYGSSVQPSTFDLADGLTLQLGDVVRTAFEASGLSVDDWNTQEDAAREASIAEVVSTLALKQVADQNGEAAKSTIDDAEKQSA